MADNIQNSWHNVRGVTPGELSASQKSVMEKYSDIIDCDVPVSYRHPPMDISKRAAQFMPFAALQGYDDYIADTQEAAEYDVQYNGEHYEAED